MVSQDNWAEMLRRAAHDRSMTLATLANRLGTTEEEVFARLVRLALGNGARSALYRETQRTVCLEMLNEWRPFAKPATTVAVQEGKAPQKDAFDNALKAGQFVLKIMERQAKLDNVDAKDDETAGEGKGYFDPNELQERTEAVEGKLAEVAEGVLEMCVSEGR